jgi:hypothetical protein
MKIQVMGTAKSRFSHPVREASRLPFSEENVDTEEIPGSETR